MIVHVSPGAPQIVHLAATAALVGHIGAGCIGLVSGGVALVARKGAALHRASGNVFFVAILTMAAIGAGMAPLLPQRSSVAPGMITFYLTLTAWLAVRRPGPAVRRFDIAAMVIAIAAVALNLTWGLEAENRVGGVDGDGPATFFAFGSMAALAVVLDISVLARGGVAGPQRIGRHLWRMCLALLITSTSFFLGQQKVFPAGLRDSPVLFLPELAVFAALVFWSIKVRSSRRPLSPSGLARGWPSVRLPT